MSLLLASCTAEGAGERSRTILCTILSADRRSQAVKHTAIALSASMCNNCCAQNCVRHCHRAERITACECVALTLRLPDPVVQIRSLLRSMLRLTRVTHLLL